jgi:hypothetical protein
VCAALDPRKIIGYPAIDGYVTYGRAVLHTPQYVSERSSLLLTVICAQAATLCPDGRFGHDLSIRLLNHARTLTHQVISDGYRSIEICQALMSYCEITLLPKKGREVSTRYDRSLVASSAFDSGSYLELYILVGRVQYCLGGARLNRV